MERYLSVGVSTLVALMAAHRAAADGGETRAAFSQEEIARIEAELRAARWRDTRDGTAGDGRRGLRAAKASPSQHAVLIRAILTA